MLLSILLDRPGAPATAMRLQVCPPSLHRALPAWWPLWLVALRRALPQPGASRADDRLRAARTDFLGVLADLRGDAIVVLRARIRCSHSMRELWHLRGALFNLLCTSLSESLANERLELLNRHFPTRAPRSGFASLEGPSR